MSPTGGSGVKHRVGWSGETWAGVLTRATCRPLLTSLEAGSLVGVGGIMGTGAVGLVAAQLRFHWA